MTHRRRHKHKPLRLTRQGKLPGKRPPVVPRWVPALRRIVDTAQAAAGVVGRLLPIGRRLGRG